MTTSVWSIANTQKKFTQNIWNYYFKLKAVAAPMTASDMGAPSPKHGNTQQNAKIVNN